MSGFTKGPWAVQGSEVWATHGIRFNLTTVGTPLIARVCEHKDAERGFPYEANARLIASAPELYERLKEARDAIASLPEYALGGESIYSSHTGEIVGDYPIRDKLLHHIDAALSKAAGEGV